ncbi:MAG: hypothetical protein ACKO4T_08110 [Planctomycetaceae bacterium]
MRRPLLALLLVTVASANAPAIEMFTYFGDGSRIGLPNLEVPIEAYPGIPLRSDRLRARRRAMRTGSAVRVGPGTPLGGVTIRPMQAYTMPPPAAQPRAESRGPSPESRITNAQGRPAAN